MKCPGQDSRLWGPDAIFEADCPQCGEAIEFFRDESSRRCRRCGHRAVNPRMDFGCAAYCRYAEQCLGALPPELAAKRAGLLKNRVAAEVKKFLGNDFRRIGRALKVVEYAEKMQKTQKADPAVVTLAAHLWAVGAWDARSRRETAESGPTDRLSVARILSRTGAPAEIAGEILAILEGIGKPGGPDSPNFRCVHDAVRIAALEEEQKNRPRPPETLSEAVERSLLTGCGRDLARQVLRLPERL